MGNNLCFDFHGKEGEMFDLISDQSNGKLYATYTVFYVLQTPTYSTTCTKYNNTMIIYIEITFIDTYLISKIIDFKCIQVCIYTIIGTYLSASYVYQQYPVCRFVCRWPHI